MINEPETIGQTEKGFSHWVRSSRMRSIIAMGALIGASHCSLISSEEDSSVGSGGAPDEVEEDFSCPDGQMVTAFSKSLGNLSGIQVEEGQSVHLTANPRSTWTMENGSKGALASGRYSDGPFVSKVGGASYGEMVGWIDNCEAAAFRVGMETTLSAPCSGEIVLAANDNWDPGCMRTDRQELGCHYDNTGSIDVCVEVGTPDNVGNAGAGGGGGTPSE